MALNGNGYLRVAEPALHDTSITNHDWKGVDRSGRKVEKLGHSQLHRVVRTAAIDKDGELVMLKGAIRTEGFRS